LLEPFDSKYGLRITVGCDGAPMHVADLEYEPDELQTKYQAALGLLLKNRDAAQNEVVTMFLPK
jgi:hypothetical protein